MTPLTEIEFFYARLDGLMLFIVEWCFVRYFFLWLCVGYRCSSDLLFGIGRVVRKPAAHPVQSAPVPSTTEFIAHLRLDSRIAEQILQEAQLTQRNSASAAHM